jgi:hypothetical protein
VSWLTSLSAQVDRLNASLSRSLAILPGVQAEAAAAAPALQKVADATTNVLNALSALGQQGGAGAPGGFSSSPLGLGGTTTTQSGANAISPFFAGVTSQQFQESITKWLAVSKAVAASGHGNGFANLVSIDIQKVMTGQMSFQAMESDLLGQLAVFRSSFEMSAATAATKALRDLNLGLESFIDTGGQAGVIAQLDAAIQQSNDTGGNF